MHACARCNCECAALKRRTRAPRTRVQDRAIKVEDDARAAPVQRRCVVAHRSRCSHTASQARTRAPSGARHKRMGDDARRDASAQRLGSVRARVWPSLGAAARAVSFTFAAPLRPPSFFCRQLCGHRRSDRRSRRARAGRARFSRHGAPLGARRRRRRGCRRRGRRRARLLAGARRPKNHTHWLQPKVDTTGHDGGLAPRRAAAAAPRHPRTATSRRH
jgi:hypothetical protein